LVAGMYSFCSNVMVMYGMRRPIKKYVINNARADRMTSMNKKTIRIKHSFE